MIFWNIVGIRNKDSNFWNFIEMFDVVGLTETWVGEQYWESMKSKLSTGYRCKLQGASREKEKGRTSGVVVARVRTNLEEREVLKGVTCSVHKWKFKIKGK